MITISEAISTIKKAENDAKKLLEDANQGSSEIIEKANEESISIMEKTKEDANERYRQIIFESEGKAKNEANRILRETEKEVSNIKAQTEDKIDEAATVITNNIL
ncbi:MAG: ATP synthase archaeal subunit H [Euryarchaeota archaeon]|nr:ATP synthase archaeal subunit H [Euryarchaeota archaeon]